MAEIDCRNDAMAVDNRPSRRLTSLAMSIWSTAASARQRMVMCMGMCMCLRVEGHGG